LSGNLLRKVVQKEIKIIEQHRGGLGTMITKTNEKNRVLSTIKCDSNDRILFITEKGFGIVIAATDIPLLGKSSKKPFVISNLLLPQNSQGDFSKVAVVTTISNELIDSLQLVVITEKGTITKIEIRKIIKKRARLAKRIMRVDEDDKVVGTTFISGKGFLLITGDRGHVLSFPVSLIPVRSGLVSKGVKTMFFASKKTPRRSTKVTGIFFLPEDLVFNQESQVLITSERGMAKLLRINSLKFVERRRGVGSKLSFSRTTDKIASVVGLANLGQVIIFTKNGRVLKTDSKTIRKLISRTAKGVRCIRMVENDQVISVLPVTRSGKNEKISEE